MADTELIASLQQQRAELTSQAQNQIQAVQDARTTLTNIQNNFGDEEEIAAAQQAVYDAENLVNETKDQIKLIDQQIEAATDPPTTNLSESEIEAELRQQTTDVVGENKIPSLSDVAGSAIKAVGGLLSGAAGLFGKVLFGAVKPQVPVASVTFKNVQGDVITEDQRVKIRVPLEYITDLTAGPAGELESFQGIIFPYTPSISYESKADYTPMNPLHSNFSIYFYKNSSVSPIKVTGKFTVQNDRDASIYLATCHLLKALTKMRSGGLSVDALSGSPPPICRLDAYGTMMLSNVPVVVSSFSVELPDNVDYYTVGKTNGTVISSVPIVSTISVNLIPIYSRAEMQKFNVNEFLNSVDSRKSGYL